MKAVPSNGAAFRCQSPLKTIFFVVLETRLIQQLYTRVVFEKASLYASTGVGRFLTGASQKRSFARSQTMPAAYRTIFSVFWGCTPEPPKFPSGHVYFSWASACAMKTRPTRGCRLELTAFGTMTTTLT